MAEWSNATMTDVGADLQAKVNAGKTKLTFTKIKVGSGVNATNPLALTDVISSKWETTNFVVKQEGKIVSVDTFITNTGIHEAFRMSEIGLFAQDPDKGEVLYAYLTDPEPDRMPAEGGSVVVSQELTIGMVFSNTGNVSLTVNMGALVTHEQLEAHNSDEHAHDNLFNAIIEKVNSMITPTDDGDKQSLAPTLALVKELIKNHNDDINTHENLFPKIKQMIIDMMTWKNVPGLTKPGHLFAANTIKEIPLPTGWRRLKVCVAWDGNTTDFNKFTQNMFPRLLEPNNGAVREFDVMQVKLSNNKQFSVLDEDGFGYTINESKLIITSAGKDGNDYIVAMYYM